MKVVGYGICAGGESDRYLDATLKEFKRLCDQVIIVCNNTNEKDNALIDSYGFRRLEDNREWGLYQNKIKDDLMIEVAKLHPTYLVALDMDEVFDPLMTKEKLMEMLDQTDALYFYIVNLWNDGWRKASSFWNVRAWKWSGQTKFSNRPLHCGLAPEWCYFYGSYCQHFVKHYGLMKREDRQKKIARYQKYDPQARYKDVSYYNSLASDTCDVLDENWIREQLKAEAGVLVKKQMQNKKEKFCYVRNPHGVIVDIPVSHLQDTLSRKGFAYIGDVVADRSEELPVIEPPTQKE